MGEAVNRARDLQNRPGNDLTPTALGDYVKALGAAVPGLTVEVLGREGIGALGMGAFAAVAQGSEQEPALITIRYDGPDPSGPTLGFVGKAVTFDSGGISLKPGAKMAEMKFDMSGGSAVIEAVSAIARLQLPVKLVAVVGATENLPSGRAIKPGDIVTAANGKTIEVNNTDAEGRLVLADCLCHAVSEGAERIVDLATLTGAVIVALGSTYAGMMSNDDEFAERIAAAGDRSGEIVWRLPLHEEYDELVKGTYADLDNAPEARKAGTIVGGAFLSNFVAEVPWAHLDIAGSAWDLDRAYVGKGASGYAVRLLVELARSFASSGCATPSGSERACPACRRAQRRGRARLIMRPGASSCYYEKTLYHYGYTAFLREIRRPARPALPPDPAPCCPVLSCPVLRGALPVRGLRR